MPRYFQRNALLAWLKRASQTPFTYFNRRRQLLEALHKIASFVHVAEDEYVLPTDVWVQLVTTLDARNEAINDNSRLFFRKFVEETLDELSSDDEERKVAGVEHPAGAPEPE